MKIIVVGLSACMLLSGCGNAIPELTEMQQNMITEYAVGTVLKYSANYDDKIICKELEKIEESEKEATEQKKQENVTEETDTPQAPVVSEDEMVDVPSVSGNDGVNTPVQSLDSFLQVDGFTVEFQGSEICDAYSGTDDDVVAFELQASEGNSLLVLKYSVTNITDQEQRFDMLSKNMKAKISVAGNSRSALLTMLENDLLHADTMVGANETCTFVILTEIKADTEVGQIVLTLINNGEKAKYSY